MNRFRIEFDIFSMLGFLFTIIGIVFTISSVWCTINYESIKYQINGDAKLFIGVSCSIGILMALIGSVFIGVWFHNIKIQRKIYNNGYYIQVPISAVRMDTRIRINGHYPFVVEAQYIDPNTKKIYLFQSRYMRCDPSGYLNDSVRVYVIPPDYQHYYIDVDSF